MIVPLHLCGKFNKWLVVMTIELLWQPSMYLMTQSFSVFHNVSLAAVTAILFGLMGYRFYNSGKFMPAGLVAALSLAQVVRLAIRFA